MPVSSLASDKEISFTRNTTKLKFFSNSLTEENVAECLFLKRKREIHILRPIRELVKTL